MHLRLDHHSGEPIYRQIVEQVKYQIACGQAKPGAKLPSIRVLSSQLKINPRTVVKAYEELEYGDLVVMRHGQGVFVSENRGGVAATARKKALTEMARRMLAEAARMGAEGAEVVQIIKRVSEQMEKHK